MDFLDAKKARRGRIKLLLGYCLITLAIAIATLVLLYWSYGYNIDSQAKVTQNGLMFVSSQPSSAAIYLNGQRYKSDTNSRVVVPSGAYTLKISLTGYRTWQRPVAVNGGDVQHFDYPFLFPAQLKTSNLTELATEPSVATQSPDKHWLLLGQADNSGTFTQLNLKDSKKPVKTDVNLPAPTFTVGTGQQTWSLVEWATDNRHVLLLHTFILGNTTRNEYILLDRDTPVDSLNLSSTLNLTQSETLNLYNDKVDQFYVYDQDTHILKRVNASDASTVSQIEHVLTFKPYGSDRVLYTTDISPATGKSVANQVSAVLQDGQKTIVLRALPAGAPAYALNLAQYSGDWYIGLGASNDTAAYIYKNPQSGTSSTLGSDLRPWRRIAIANPSYLAFSNNTQFLLIENAQDFTVYDAENIAQYHYHATQTIDQPQLHASWMDGDRLLYVSGGKLVVFDYDYRNRQVLETANPAYLPFFSSDYKFVYSLIAGDGGAVKPVLTSTPLTVSQ